jgi:hypothetical protein
MVQIPFEKLVVAKSVMNALPLGAGINLIGRVTGYGLYGRGSISGSFKIFLFFGVILIQWVKGAISSKSKRPGREVGHLLPSSAEVKNGEAIPPFSNMSS